MQIQDIVDDITVEVPFPSELTLERAVRQTLADFLRSTQFWREDISITIVGGTSRYAIDTPEGSYPFTIARAELIDMAGGSSQLRSSTRVNYISGYTPCNYKVSGSDVLLDGDNGKRLDLEVVLLPARVVEEIPDHVAEPYFEGLRAGAIARLLRMPEKEWTNLKLAAVYERVYDRAKLEATREADGSVHRPARKVRYAGL